MMTTASFFFSSRRRHTRLTCDWSSDVCSSDLEPGFAGQGAQQARLAAAIAADQGDAFARVDLHRGLVQQRHVRSEERRVGKECRSGWWMWRDKRRNGCCT